jgi:hypothetical protein
MQALFVGFPCKGTSARSGQPWHAGERSKRWRRCRRWRWGWRWWKLEMVYVKIRLTDVLGSAPMAAGLARRRPPIVATQPAARSSRTLLALAARCTGCTGCTRCTPCLQAPHRTRLLGGAWRACTDLRAALQPTPTKITFQHLARPHCDPTRRGPPAALFTRLRQNICCTAGIPPSSWRVLCAPCLGCTRLSMSLDPCHSSGPSYRIPHVHLTRPIGPSRAATQQPR